MVLEETALVVCTITSLRWLKTMAEPRAQVTFGDDGVLRESWLFELIQEIRALLRPFKI